MDESDEELNLYEYNPKPKLNIIKILILIISILLIVIGFIVYWQVSIKTVETSTENQNLNTIYLNNLNSKIENNNESLSIQEEPIKVELEDTNSIIGDPNFDINTIDQTNNIIDGYTDKNEYVYVKSKVHIREFDNKDSQIIVTVDEGAKFLRIGINENGWSKIVFNNSIAYINSDFLTTDELVEPEHNDVELIIRNNRNIDSSKPMVALTFDDGPNSKSTPQILDILEKYNSVATFFDLGACMEKYPEISQREEAIGCEVESHTYSHKNLNILTNDQIKEEINKAEEIYQNTLGHSFQIIRPPYGNANNIVKSISKYPLINWDIDSLDWQSKDANSIIRQIRRYNDYDGRIILMHSIYTSTAEALDTIIPELLSKGYQLVTISEMVKYKNITLQTGNIYLNFK